MAGEADKTKGRVKEAAGDLSGRRDLKREGKVDRAGGESKRGIDKITRGLKDLFGRRRA
jgi:uncharacterized protein YjbJ (UPF0337 family)